MSSLQGYYKINADATALTYTAVATVWGVIGSASPKGWDDETPLTYNPCLLYTSPSPRDRTRSRMPSSA